MNNIDPELSVQVDAYIHPVQNFPKPGFLFKDITPLLAEPVLFGRALQAMADPFMGQGITKVVGVEARGFLLGPTIALTLGVGFVPARKRGKLPRPTVGVQYILDYGTDELHLHVDAIGPGDRVLVVDDVLATGGTADAVEQLVGRLGGQVVGFSFLLDLAFLPGRRRLGPERVHAVVVTPTA